MREPRTHDYTARYWSHDFGIREVNTDGTLSAFGWGRGIAEGDFLILPNNNRSTRYRVGQIRYEIDPNDMWFAILVFAPRKEANDDRS